jgi:hypothetical protein
VLYVSTSTIAGGLVGPTVKKIVADAVAQNRLLQITGSLMFTGTNFAQIMEGPPDSIAALMERLGKDRHHRDIVVLEDIAIADRRFGKWAMAYAGPSVFVARTVERAVADAAAGSTRAVHALVRLMGEFARCS